jgi:hypothetical protein
VIDGYYFHGHAIVSADDRIADRSGLMPEGLRNEADWSRFQAALDAACLTVLGRRGHEVNANAKGRNRLVLSSSADGIERRADAWWWNPAKVPLGDALAQAAPSGGIVVVPGGCRVFDHFLSAGFDKFHLAQAPRVRIPDGVPLFSELNTESTAERVLAAHGLVADPTEMLDPDAGVEMTLWRRR